ncbi:hypothetical protein GCM10010193_69760 [Kitasatospora atroaurantiaca]|uniref:Uncharacterized protein n=1 Tax=Kitasatospora atroaurantiaca TaxID=285545 RepID=A0A561EN57_9ACTN|nr:hypothetical protein [Kitasatospora atroaurantiaca]TWE17061.1 hypothetical protein FB465_2065 [Kitasatospora atroaurantiaca]
MTTTPQPAARPVACTRCGSPCAVAEDTVGLIDWGPAVVDADGVVRPQYPDPEDEYQTVTNDVGITRTRAVCSNRSCRHQWTLRRRLDPSAREG